MVKRLETEARETGGSARAGDHRRRHPAQRRRARHRDDRLGRRSAERRHEGADHRPRRAEHPGARDSYRRRADRRRHARGDHPVQLRPVPPRGRPPGHRATDRGRPHPPRPHRGGGREGQGGDGRHRPARGGSGRLRARALRPPPRGAPAHGPLEVPHQLRPERPQPLEGSGVPRRDHGEGAWTEQPGRGPRRVPARHRQGDRPRPAGHAPRARARRSCASTAKASPCCRRWPRITWISTGRRSKR